MKNGDWNWTPGIGVGPIKFGVPIADYLSDFDLELVNYEEPGEPETDAYEVPGQDKAIWVEDGRVDSINCDDFFGYKGKNLIGMSEKEFLAHMGQEPEEIGSSVEYENGSVQTPYEYPDLGLQIWFEDGKVVSAMVSEIVDD